jgi:hypothetical protein
MQPKEDCWNEKRASVEVDEGDVRLRRSLQPTAQQEGRDNGTLPRMPEKDESNVCGKFSQRMRVTVTRHIITRSATARLYNS